MNGHNRFSLQGSCRQRPGVSIFYQKEKKKDMSDGTKTLQYSKLTWPSCRWSDVKTLQLMSPGGAKRHFRTCSPSCVGASPLTKQSTNQRAEVTSCSLTPLAAQTSGTWPSRPLAPLPNVHCCRSLTASAAVWTQPPLIRCQGGAWRRVFLAAAIGSLSTGERQNCCPIQFPHAGRWQRTSSVAV